MFADVNNPHVLSKLVEDPFSIEVTEICDADFKLRSKQRTMYPGACALVYESLMQIVIECLLGWNSEEQRGGQVGGEGIFSILEAWARTDEEQGRKTLHGHWLLWVRNINEIREALHSKDLAQREAARQSFLQYVDKVICAHYDSDFVVDHECQHGVVSGTAADMFKEVDVHTYREARHKDACLKHKGRLMFCPECKQRYSPEEVIRAACARVRSNGSVSVTPTESTIGNVDKLPKKWLDIASLRYPYDFHGDNCTMADCDTTRENWLRNKKMRSVLMHLRFDQHEELHVPYCFKKNDECRASLPMMVCNKSFLFDNQHILSNSSDFHVVHASESSTDEELQAMEEVNWHHLSSECPVTRVSQFLVIPKRPQACQFLNQHSIPISEVISCNTNVCMGDASCVYYNTLYKTKNTQKEDKHTCRRACAQIGRRVLRAEAEKRRRQQLTEQNNDNDLGGADNINGESDDLSKEIEGLGRILTGTYAMCAQDTVSSTLAHILIMQDGERFVYSHGFTPLLISQLEDCLEGKEMFCKLRVNKEEKTEKLQLWPDSSANDYLSRSKLLENYCAYEMAMDFEKKYNTYKEVNEMLAAKNKARRMNTKRSTCMTMICENGITSWKITQGISTHT